MMTNKDIEEDAIDAVKKSVRATQVLEQYISGNDREPSWDGKVYVYSNEKKLKADIIGRVDVQVKGKISEKFDLEKIKYKVDTRDLKNFLNDRGVIFFVVLISKDGEQNKIYYNALLPVKLKEILEKSENKKTKTLEFDVFPEDKEEKISIFNEFCIDSKKQISFINGKFEKVEDLVKYGEAIDVSKPAYLKKLASGGIEAVKSHIGKETYLYRTLPNSDIEIPLNKVFRLNAVAEEVCSSVYINEKEYYLPILKSYDEKRKKEILHIGNSISIIPNESGRGAEIKIKMASMLSERIVDISLFLDLIENKEFNIGNIKVPMDINFDGGKVREINQELENCKKIETLLILLNIKEDINLIELTDDDIENLSSLVSAFVDNEKVKLKNSSGNRQIYVKIQGIGILIHVHEEIEGSGAYRCGDFLGDEGLILVTELDTGEKIQYPRFSSLKKEHYELISNIPYDKFIETYKMFEKENPDVYSQANLDVLQMLLAYDICKKRIIIDTAIELMRWILEDGVKDKCSKNIYQINYLQAIIRTRELNDEEKRLLLAITMDDEVQDDIKFAANVLLKQLPLAEAYLQRLELEVVEQIKNFPIYNLFEVFCKK